MGTRGALVLIGNEAVRTVYNHYDSYPGGLGYDVLTWLRAVLKFDVEGEEQARKAIASLAPVPDREPTAEDIARLAEFHDPDVSSGRDWYALLRKTQGDISAMLRAGYYEPAEEFPLDSLFCEWAYVVDFDARTFDVYQGFQKTPPTAGRWVGAARIEAPEGIEGKYYPVNRIASFSFDDLPVELDGTWTDDETYALHAPLASQVKALEAAVPGATVVVVKTDGPEGWTSIQS